MIVKSTVLPLSQAAAFDLVTQRITALWPGDRRLTGDPSSSIIMLETGRFYERASDGRELELGKVLAWQCPTRILLDFYLGTGQGRPTALELTFAAEGDGTKVTVTHRPKPGSMMLWAAIAPRLEPAWNAVISALSTAVT